MAQNFNPNNNESDGFFPKYLPIKNREHPLYLTKCRLIGFLFHRVEASSLEVQLQKEMEADNNG